MSLSLSLGLSLSARGRRGFTPASLFANDEAGAWFDPSDLSTLFSDTAGTVEAAGIAGDVRRINDLSGNSNDATSATAWLLRRDGVYGLERDGGTFAVTLPDLGTNATLAYVDEATGVTVSGGLTIGAGAYNLPTSARLGPVVILDRALTTGETSQLTAWLTARRPGNWLLGLGAWDDTGAWDDSAAWQTAA